MIINAESEVLQYWTVTAMMMVHALFIQWRLAGV